MKCFVTGASGFVGANLVHELMARGHEVRVLVRPESDLRGIAGLPVEKVSGDLLSSGLPRLIEGCGWVFHVAASYHLWLKDYAPMYRSNVDGTRHLLESAGKAGCDRIVYTSTVGCIGLPKSNGTGAWPDEANDPFPGQLSNHYKRSKWEAEKIARQKAAEGLPVVIVNPSAPIGPRDVKPTPTGKVILDFLNRQMPAYLDTGLNFVHVRDVAIGHILAAEKGRVGERYILGHAQGNLTLEEALRILAELTGLPAPRFQVPYWVAWAAAMANEAVAGVSGIPPKAPLAGVRMAKYKMFFNPSKAIRELGLPQTDPKSAFGDAIEWFRKEGYAQTK